MRQVPVVSAENPKLEDVPVWAEWVGTLTGTVNASILPQVSGYVKSQNYRNGDLVKKGDLLFTIERTVFQDQVDQAEANLAKAKAQWQEADYNKNLYKPLVSGNIISKQKYEDAVLSAQAAQASIVAGEAALNLAKRNLGYTEIVAPIDGVAGVATVQLGDLVSPEGNIMTKISSVDPIRVDFSVTESFWLNQEGKSDNLGVRPGSELAIILPNNKVFSEKAEVFAVDRAFNSSTGTILIQAQLKNPGMNLRPGMFVRVKALMEISKDAMTVPQKAIFSTQGRFFVVTLDEKNKPHMIPVAAGAHWNERQIVTPLLEGSLSPQSRIVVEGLQDAMMVAGQGSKISLVVTSNPQ